MITAHCFCNFSGRMQLNPALDSKRTGNKFLYNQVFVISSSYFLISFPKDPQAFRVPLMVTSEKQVMVVGFDDHEHSAYALEWTLKHFFAPFASNPPFQLVIVHVRPRDPSLPLFLFLVRTSNSLKTSNNSCSFDYACIICICIYKWVGFILWSW